MGTVDMEKDMIDMVEMPMSIALKAVRDLQSKRNRLCSELRERSMLEYSDSEVSTQCLRDERKDMVDKILCEMNDIDIQVMMLKVNINAANSNLSLGSGVEGETVAKALIEVAQRQNDIKHFERMMMGGSDVPTSYSSGGVVMFKELVGYCDFKSKIEQYKNRVSTLQYLIDRAHMNHTIEVENISDMLNIYAGFTAKE